MDSGHGGKRSNSGRKRKYDGRGEYKKAINVFISKREFFARVNSSAQVNSWQCPFNASRYLSRSQGIIYC